MSPLAILALIFGSLTGGNSGHFRTAHGVRNLLSHTLTVDLKPSLIFETGPWPNHHHHDPGHFGKPILHETKFQHRASAS